VGRGSRRVHRGSRTKQADQGLHLAAAVGHQTTTAGGGRERATSAFRYMFGTESVVESYLALPVFFGLLPGNAYQVPDRWLTCLRSSVLHALTATYKTDLGREYLTDRFRIWCRTSLTRPWTTRTPLSSGLRLKSYTPSATPDCSVSRRAR
jgi:hypothetical protein